MRLHASQGEAPRSGAGLVPSINNGETVDAFPSSGEDWIKVDHVKARCTRLRKNLGVAAKWLSKGAGQAWMLTLTYADKDGWRADHIKAAMQLLRKWLKRSYGWSLRYLWVMELQKRGAPHYHVVVWLPREVEARALHLDSRGWWPHGMTNAVQAVAPVRYVMKYVSKFDSKESFPKGARCYGIGGLELVAARCRRWINWPSFVQARADVATEVHRARGGGWFVAGTFYDPEWGLSAIGRGYTRLVRLVTHPPGPLAGAVGPFSWLPAFTGRAGAAFQS